MTGWLETRRRVYHRDRGICQVCLLPVGPRWDAGHLVDRCVGGSNLEDNLVLMCQHDNRRRKPIHQSRADALEWLLAEQQLARRRTTDEWRPFYDALYGRTT